MDRKTCLAIFVRVTYTFASHQFKVTFVPSLCYFEMRWTDIN